MKQIIKCNVPFTTWLGTVSLELDAAGRFGTARNYRRACRSFSQFLSESRSPLWPDENTIIGYSSWLQRRGVVRNTISFYMRILRSAYNKAVSKGLVPADTPFTKVYTGIDSTRKRAVDEKFIARLLHLDLRGKPALKQTRDMFIFSYCTRGMAFIDMVMLEKKNIRGDMLVYCRKKTGRRLSVKIEDRVRDTIEKYSRSGSRYIFPVLGNLSPETEYRHYQTALGYYNRNLKRLSRMIGSDVELSSHTARHSWASCARKHNIPVSVISAGMGHDSEKTTLIYLSSLDSSAIDNANRKLMASLVKMEQAF